MVVSYQNQSFATEQDLIRILCESKQFKFKSNWIETDSDTLSQAGKSNETAVRQCRIIWSGFSKFIRSQANKGRLIDSLFFGQFFKKDNEYGCVHDTMYSPVLNSENFDSKGDLDLESATVNIKAIAQVCGCSPDQVTYFLQKFKDLVFRFPLDTKRTVCLNMSCGQLMFYPNQTSEFKGVEQT